MASKKLIPKSRQSIINKKRAERLARRQEQEQEDYSNDFNNLFNENVITYHNKYITDVFNEAKDLLDFNYVITTTITLIFISIQREPYLLSQ